MAKTMGTPKRAQVPDLPFASLRFLFFEDNEKSPAGAGLLGHEISTGSFVD